MAYQKQKRLLERSNSTQIMLHRHQSNRFTASRSNITMNDQLDWPTISAIENDLLQLVRSFKSFRSSRIKVRRCPSTIFRNLLVAIQVQLKRSSVPRTPWHSRLEVIEFQRFQRSKHLRTTRNNRNFHVQRSGGSTPIAERKPKPRPRTRFRMLIASKLRETIGTNSRVAHTVGILKARINGESAT